MTFNDAESHICRHLVALALYEDLNPEPFVRMPSDESSDEASDEPFPVDRTSKAIISPEQRGTAFIVARRNGILAGLPAVELVIESVPHWLLPFHLVAEKGHHRDFKAPETPTIQLFFEDGNAVRPGDRIARADGLMLVILEAERTALNFLQHLSGIATLTWRFVEAIKGLPCRTCGYSKRAPDKCAKRQRLKFRSKTHRQS